MGKAGFARSGKGTSVSKGGVARSGNMALNKALPGSMVEAKVEGRVSSNIPGSDAQGVPDANGKDEGSLAREGNENMSAKAVQLARGSISYGPAEANQVARTGGQIGLSPNQIGAWSQKAGN